MRILEKKPFLCYEIQILIIFNFQKNPSKSVRSISKALLSRYCLKVFINPLTTSVCRANQLAGFYMMDNISREWVNPEVLK